MWLNNWRHLSLNILGVTRIHTNLENLVKSHVAGRGNFTSEIHRMLALELIQRELIKMN